MVGLNPRPLHFKSVISPTGCSDSFWTSATTKKDSIFSVFYRPPSLPWTLRLPFHFACPK
ncbi:hypothetical protein CsSME_00004529 [Camellia sinensis var. sinensis]